MSLVTVELPLASLERLIAAVERVALACERIAGPPVEPPVYDRTRRHVSDANYALIADVENLNTQRARQGLAPLTFEEGVASLRNEDVDGISDNLES